MGLSLAEYTMETLKPELKGLKTILQNMLSDESSHVKRAAFEATASVIAELEVGPVFIFFVCGKSEFTLFEQYLHTKEFSTNKKRIF